MKISFNWLKEYINLDISPEKTAELLTDCGLEVESVEEISYCSEGPGAGKVLTGGLKGCVIGEVKSKEKHPDADRLSLTTVDIGTGTDLNIVCGAPNVATGQKVIVATVGTTLHPSKGEPLTLRKAKIRGAVSEGMICAEDELGLGESHEGIMVLDTDAAPGITASEYFKIETDHVLEIGLTPNRADAASHIGVAKDLIAVFNRDLEKEKYFLNIPALEEEEESRDDLKIRIKVEDETGCIRYSGLTIDSIVVKESPGWLKSRLRAIGLSPINNVVDITNFVLHETGQPLHAFDADKIDGAEVKVKKLKEGTEFITLDGVKRKLSSDDLMICSATKPMCIAGVFGGQDSGVTDKTTSIFLESACFEPGTIRRSSKRHGLKTDASFRFERGTDPNLCTYALERAAQLMVRVAGGNITSQVGEHYPAPVKEEKIALSYHNCDRLIGKKIDRKLIVKILESLDMKVVSDGLDAVVVEVPTNKTDVHSEADLVEEILRIYGFNQIGIPTRLNSSIVNSVNFEAENKMNAISSLLIGMGYSEIMSNSLSDIKNTDQQDTSVIRLENPLSPELSILRPNLIFSGLEAIAYNHNRKNLNLKLFELGKSYKQAKGEIIETSQLALYLTGNKYEESWIETDAPVDLFTLKGHVEAIFTRAGISTSSIKEFSSDLFGSGLSYSTQNGLLAELGFVKKTLLKKFDIKVPAFAAVLNIDLLLKESLSGRVSYRELSKFPEVRRDLALVVDIEVDYDLLKDLAYSTEKKLLKKVNLFDVYEGDKIEKGKKSYALSFILGNEEATLTDEEVDKTMTRLIKVFKEKANATIRS